MTLPEWINECDQLQRSGMPYTDLAKKFGVKQGTLAGFLHRFRNPEKDWCANYREGAGSRFKRMLRKRRTAVHKLLSGRTIPSKHRAVLEAYAEGLTNRECGERAGCSWTWANLILRSYNLDTHKWFSRHTRARVGAARRGPKAKTQ